MKLACAHARPSIRVQNLVNNDGDEKRHEDKVCEDDENVKEKLLCCVEVAEKRALETTCLRNNKTFYGTGNTQKFKVTLRHSIKYKVDDR